MLSLNSNAFTLVCTFVPPKTLFASKRVSKKWNDRLASANLWKTVMRGQHPMAHEAKISPNPEQFLRDISKPLVTWILLRDIEFLLTIYRENVVLGSIHWRGKPESEFKFDTPLVGIDSQNIWHRAKLYIRIHEHPQVSYRFCENMEHSDGDDVDFATFEDTMTDFQICLKQVSQGKVSVEMGFFDSENDRYVDLEEDQYAFMKLFIKEYRL